MGIYFSKNNLPYFKADSDSPELELKTSQNVGFKIENVINPNMLEPFIFYQFGTITTPVRIFKFVSYSKENVETYIGEFTIGPGGSISFPSSIRWSQEPKFEEGFTYQFTIINGIGSYIKVKTY